LILFFLFGDFLKFTFGDLLGMDFSCFWGFPIKPIWQLWLVVASRHPRETDYILFNAIR